MDTTYRSAVYTNGTNVVLVPNAGRLTFPPLSDSHTNRTADAHVTVPDFGRGKEDHFLFHFDLALHNGVGVSWDVNDVLLQWKEGKVALCPVVGHVLGRLVNKNKDWTCNNPLLELQYAPNVLVCPIRSRTSPPFIHTNVVVFLAGAKALLLDPGSSDTATLMSLLSHLQKSCGVSSLFVLITHIHLDHWEALSFVQQNFGGTITVCASEPCFRALGSGVQAKGKQIVFSMEKESELQVGDSLTVRIVPTPGISRFKVCFVVIFSKVW
jgi:hypothetical protein